MEKDQIEEKLPETVLTISKEKFKSLLDEQIRVGNIMYSAPIENETDLSIAEGEFKQWHENNLSILGQSFNNPENEYRLLYSEAGRTNEFNGFIFGLASATPLFGLGVGLYQHYWGSKAFFKKAIFLRINVLHKIFAKVDLLKTSFKSNEGLSSELTDDKKNKNIFIVHGHGEKIKIDVARTLTQLGLNPIILHEQANKGRTIIEKFEIHSDVDFAVVLLTGDDVGKKSGAREANKRARQNVILEMGYFIGKLGRDRVFALREEEVEVPSDLYGIVYEPIDAAGRWRFALVQELRAAGYEVDANRLLVQ